MSDNRHLDYDVLISEVLSCVYGLLSFFLKYSNSIVKITDTERAFIKR